jgi:nitrite reductase/ring-hydroxylating ferredoxin subunit
MSSLCAVARATPVTRASAKAVSDRASERRAVVAHPKRAFPSVIARPLDGVDAAIQRRGDGIVARARKGTLADTLDGDGGKKKKKDKKAVGGGATSGGSDSMAGSLEPQFAGRGSSSTASKANAAREKNWIEVGNVNIDFKEKPIKPLVLANGNFILVQWEDLIFCADCNSTAYQFPLVDGEIFFGVNGPAIRVPLDGTEYDLTTGDVITWCPKNNVIRTALGTLKGAADPIPLPVYPARVEADGTVLTNFVDKVERKKGFSNDAAGPIEGGKGVEIAARKDARVVTDSSAAERVNSVDAKSSEGESSVSPALLVALGFVALAAVYLQVSGGGDVPAP